MLFQCRQPGWSGGVNPWGNKPGFVGEDDGLDAVAQAQFGQDPADMDLHGALGQEQAGRDLAVGQAGGDAAEDVLLAVGKGLLYLSAAGPGARTRRSRTP
jgi:hypothetical protein